MAGTPEIHVSELPQEFFVVSRWRGLFDVAWTWLAIIGTALACGALGSVWMFALGALVIAGLQNHLMVLWHHSIHRNLHPSHAVNDAIGRWCLIAAMGQPAGLMRRAHITHHAYLGQEQDPDRWYYDLDLHGRRRPVVLLAWLAANCLGGLVVPQLRKALTGRRDGEADPGTERAARDRYDRIAVVVTQAVLFGTFWLTTGAWWGYFALWALPAATLGSGLNCLRTSLEHADPADPPHRNYSFRSNPIERFFVAPFHMNHHWEHHLLMAVPYYRMPALRRYLLEKDLYGGGRIVGSYLGRLREVTVGLASAR